MHFMTVIFHRTFQKKLSCLDLLEKLRKILNTEVNVQGMLNFKLQHFLPWEINILSLTHSA